MREADFKGQEVAIVLDVTLWWSGECFFVLEDLGLEGVQGFIEGLDSGNMVVFAFLNGGNQRVDDVDEEGVVAMMKVPFCDESGGPRGEWRHLIVGIVEHMGRMDGRVGGGKWLHFKCDSG